MTFVKMKNIFLALAGLLLAGSIYVHFLAGYVGDKNWLLMAARMWLEGKKLYVDIFESNPPLIVWLFSVPSFIALHLGLEDFHVLVFLGFCTLAAVILMARKIIAFHPEFSGDTHKQRQFMALLAFVFIFCTSPLYFFDREYIFLVLTFPYVLRWMPSASHAPLSLRLRIAIGCLAALGFCIKPHCIIVFAAIQLIYCIRERSFRILISLENSIIYLAGVLYLLAAWWFTPEYFTVVLPIALVTYSSYSESQNALFFLFIAFLSLGVTFADFRLRYKTPYRKEIFYFLQICAAFALYALANNGWSYTFNPLISTLLITTGWVFWDFRYLQKEYAAQGLPIRQFIFGARACGINFFINAAPIASVFLMLLFSSDNSKECALCNDLVKVVDDTHAHSFGLLARNFHPWPPLMRETGTTLETRFNHLWMMPKFVESDAKFLDKNKWIIRYVAEAFAEDLDRRTPDLVFVDNSPVFTKNKHADLLSYFTVFPEFAKAWQHYHYFRTLDECAREGTDPKDIMHARRACRYDVYQRVPEN